MQFSLMAKPMKELLSLFYRSGALIAANHPLHEATRATLRCSRPVMAKIGWNDSGFLTKCCDCCTTLRRNRSVLKPWARGDGVRDRCPEWHR